MKTVKDLREQRQGYHRGRGFERPNLESTQPISGFPNAIIPLVFSEPLSLQETGCTAQLFDTEFFHQKKSYETKQVYHLRGAKYFGLPRDKYDRDDNDMLVYWRDECDVKFSEIKSQMNKCEASEMVLTGSLGSGKTVLAAMYACRAHETAHTVVWINYTHPEYIDLIIIPADARKPTLAVRELNDRYVEMILATLRNSPSLVIEDGAEKRIVSGSSSVVSGSERHILYVASSSSLISEVDGENFMMSCWTEEELNTIY